MEKRQSIFRRDLNDLVRDEGGHLSPVKIGTLAGQWLSIKLILENGKDIIANWDSLIVLFSVLIAPELFKKLLNMKYGLNGSHMQTTTTVEPVAEPTPLKTTTVTTEPSPKVEPKKKGKLL